MELTGISEKWDTTLAALQNAVQSVEASDSAGAVRAALDTAADLVAAQVDALRASGASAP